MGSEVKTYDAGLEALIEARYRLELGFIAGRMVGEDDLPIDEAIAAARAGLLEGGPAFAHVYGVELDGEPWDSFENDEVCTKAAGCPECGNRWKDELAWADDGEHINCLECCTIYTPPVPKQEAAS